jgi:hypothetical protein
MSSSETPAEGRQRLRQIAKDRVDRLVSGDEISPHIGLTTESDAKESSTILLRDLKLAFRLDNYDISIKGKNDPSSMNNEPEFDIFINKYQIEGVLTFKNLGKAYFEFCVPHKLRKSLQHVFLQEDNPIYLLSKIVRAKDFREYLSLIIKITDERNATLEKMRYRIHEEAEKFREVLIRKFNQLTYIDEYETREAHRFIEEVKRFRSKRLPDVFPEFAVYELVKLVSIWAQDTQDSSPVNIFHASMTPYEYEAYCANLFVSCGWDAKLTRMSGDQGADIICTALGRRLVAQCKLYSQPVGNSAVQEIIAAREYEYADSAVVISNAPFTAAARELASVANILLIHHDEICKIKP